jgi:hypothetical protein
MLFFFSLGFKSQTPFLPESAKACQSYFWFYCKIFWKLKRETVEALRGTFGGVRLLASLFCTRRSIESDAMTHRTPKHSVQNSWKRISARRWNALSSTRWQIKRGFSA